MTDDGASSAEVAHGLGLPVEGPGSPAGWGPRIVALLIDWVVGNAAAFVLAGGSSVWSVGGGQAWLPLVCWFVLVWLATALTGASIGQHLLRLRVIRLDRRRIGLWVGLVRTVLIALVLPPLVFTRDGRGLHDLAAGTAVVNGPRAGGPTTH
ncbi:MAG: RDD family protein [Jiangellaceae bacterium]